MRVSGPIDVPPWIHPRRRSHGRQIAHARDVASRGMNTVSMPLASSLSVFVVAAPQVIVALGIPIWRVFP